MHCLADVGANLGEGPCWVVREQAIYWVDINRPTIFRWNEREGVRKIPIDKPICSIAPKASGGFIGADHDGLIAIDADFNITSIFKPVANVPTNRFNDGKVDRAGRFWAGTMDHRERASSGSLYRLDVDSKCSRIDTGYRVTNGPAFSPDGMTLYHTDSAIQRVYAFALDRNGEATGRRVFLQFQHVDGYPDGMTVDSEGCLWIAFWDGWCIRRFSPEGELLLEIAVPVQRPTSVAFGGADMATLFITSAARDLTSEDLRDQPTAGGLFAHRPGIIGVAEVPFRG
jgi:xylono-1,5-lactonase